MGDRNSPFPLGRERPLQHETYYYQAIFGKSPWEDWIGLGDVSSSTPQLCLQQMLLHPAKHREMLDTAIWQKLVDVLETYWTPGFSKVPKSG